jgi:tetratricopeptide (TPR) repeat protein
LIQEFDGLIRDNPRRADLYAGRANIFARLGRNSDAEADLARALGFRPFDLSYRSKLSALLLATGDPSAYQLRRRQTLEEFSDPDGPAVAEQVARLALLLPVEGSELAAAAKMADKAAVEGNAYSTLANRQWVKGLAEYRQSRFQGALSWMEKAVASGARRDFPDWTHEHERNRAAAAYLVMAMAHQQLGQSAEARVRLSTATEVMRSQLPEPDSGDLGRDWADVLIVHILRREAEALMGTTTKTGPAL